MSYAVRFDRIAVPKPWAGSALASQFPQSAGEWATGTGESIEVADQPGARTLVANGKWREQTLSQVMASDRQSLLGQLAGADDLPDFPLCLKFVDASQPLSVQCHPADVFHKGRRVRRGKSVGWLVLDARPVAVIYQGLKPGLNRADFEDALRNHDAPDALNARPVKAGDWLANPAGMIHAIGGGLLLYEIQQNCDQTFRLWDFPRPAGPFRALQVREGLGAARFDLPQPGIIRAEADTTLIDAGPFGVRHLHLKEPRHLGRTWAGFTLVTCLAGSCEVTSRAGDRLEPAVLAAPDTVMFPSEFWEFEFYPKPECRLALAWARAS
jgi:mannose-6-phosphate isomerase